jgi:hypothetical protein
MAQQTKSKSGRSSNTNRSKARNSAANRRPAARSRPSTGRSRNGGASRGTTSSRGSSGRSTSKSSNTKGTLDRAKETTVNGAKTAGSAVTSTAKQLKTPAIAAGVGLAGVAGGIALGRGKDKKLPLQGRSTARVTSKKLAGAAKNVGAVAEQTGQIAERVRLVSEAIGGSGARRRSPIEVVLEGLTRRSAAAPRA